MNWTLGNELFNDNLTERFKFLKGSVDSLPPMDSVGIKIDLVIPTDQPKGMIALTNAHIITMDNDNVIESGTVLVEGNKIKAIGTNIEIPVSASIIDLEGKTIMRQPYPAPNNDRINLTALAEIAWVKDLIAGVRKIRSGMNIDPRKLLPVLLQGGSSTDKQRMEDNLKYIMNVGRVESVTWLEADETAPESSTALVDEMKLLIPLAGLIDKDAELARLSKELQSKSDELGRCENKLANSGFIAKAPAAVVEKEQARAAELRNAIGSLEEQQQKIQSL